MVLVQGLEQQKRIENQNYLNFDIGKNEFPSISTAVSLQGEGEGAEIFVKTKVLKCQILQFISWWI